MCDIFKDQTELSQLKGGAIAPKCPLGSTTEQSLRHFSQFKYAWSSNLRIINFLFFVFYMYMYVR